MATGLFVKGKNNLGLKNIDLLNDRLVLMLLSTQVVLDLSSDEFQSDIPQSEIIAEKTLTGKTFIDGVFDADDVVFSSLTSISQVGSMVIAKDGDEYSTTMLIANLELSLPVQPDGTDFTVVWDNGSTKIFKL